MVGGGKFWVMAIENRRARQRMRNDARSPYRLQLTLLPLDIMLTTWEEQTFNPEDISVT
ncbi:MAG: hypothetical protein MUF49_11655 [Oculatellaceae cyanobacterium Prado106]|jgi:hypothetical protein|nr:hypothetical protein [Oculatellaceae cyanobacterium Prado106]